MDTKTLEALIRDAVSDADLRPEEIPSIDLYLDQITSLASEKRQQGSPRFYDRVLTKTMVNNYSKDGLIRPIKGKKYSKEHILQMLLVYEMKNTLSIGEIHSTLSDLYAQPGYNEKMLENIYRRYLDIKENARMRVPELVSAFLSDNALSIESREDFLVLLLGLSNLSSYLKNVTQALLEEQYSKKRKKPKKEKEKKKEKPEDGSENKEGKEKKEVKKEKKPKKEAPAETDESKELQASATEEARPE